MDKKVKIAVISSSITAAVIIIVLLLPYLQSKAEESSEMQNLLDIYGVYDERCISECSGYNFLDFDLDGICDNVADFCFISQCPSGFRCPETVECRFETQTC